jgi:hypothetical protein
VGGNRESRAKVENLQRCSNVRPGKQREKIFASPPPPLEHVRFPRHRLIRLRDAGASKVRLRSSHRRFETNRSGRLFLLQKPYVWQRPSIYWCGLADCKNHFFFFFHFRNRKNSQYPSQSPDPGGEDGKCRQRPATRVNPSYSLQGCELSGSVVNALSTVLCSGPLRFLHTNPILRETRQ